MGDLTGKPLKLAGANPPLSELSFHHCAPQKVTGSPTVAFWSPITNDPLANNVIDSAFTAVGPLLAGWVESPL